MNELKAELHKLYSDASKHSVYQNIPDFVSAELGYTEPIDETWRSDRPRLAYLTSTRTPLAGERWMDFGANTGFFTLSLAKIYPQTEFVAVEANSNHARFIQRVGQYFDLSNVEVIQRAVGIRELNELPKSDFLLHLNVLHHAGHDFDSDLVPDKSKFEQYAQRYLGLLRDCADGIFFQLGSNWGGDKTKPLVGVREDATKLTAFSGWLHNAGWFIRTISYARHDNNNRVRYEDLPAEICDVLAKGLTSTHPLTPDTFEAFELDLFPGEFYRRPLFLCDIKKTP